MVQAYVLWLFYFDVRQRGTLGLWSCWQPAGRPSMPLPHGGTAALQAAASAKAHRHTQHCYIFLGSSHGDARATLLPNRKFFGGILHMIAAKALLAAPFWHEHISAIIATLAALPATRSLFRVRNLISGTGVDDHILGGRRRRRQLAAWRRRREMARTLFLLLLLFLTFKSVLCSLR
jgi:hypothetical protein